MDKYPVVLLVHGSGGISGYVDDWAKEFNKLGIAVFILDSFGGRGLDKINNHQGKLGRLVITADAYRALDVLAKNKRVDPKRIAIMGFSRGGQVSLEVIGMTNAASNTQAPRSVETRTIEPLTWVLDGPRPTSPAVSRASIPE